MEFSEFKERVCGLDKYNKTKATLAFSYFTPVLNEENEYELSIDNMMTISKPEVDLTYVTDIFGDQEFLVLDLKFLSTYDQDLNTIYEFLKNYEKVVTNFYNDPTKCPAMMVQLVPNDALETEVVFMEMDMPMMINLVSSRTNQIPDTITMMFTLNNCSIQEDLIDLEEIKREIQNEERQEKIKQMKIEQEEKKAQERKEKEEKLMNMDMDEKEHVIRVGRDYDKENT